jgi:glucose-6-phosphate dehydrogenase assembly protein OpcA
VPARVLNLICVVDHEYSGEIANRLRRVGRFHPSRTVVCSVNRGRTTLDAVATVAAPAEIAPGQFASTRETVLVEVGVKHLKHLNTIVDPLVVTDLPTLVWAPHGHREAVDSLLKLAQIMLVDSVDEPDPEDALARARQLCERAYVVDLAWLRSTPWRERIAATFDPPAWRPALKEISGISVTAREDSVVAGMLLLGWLSCRLGWEANELIKQDDVYSGSIHTKRHDVKVKLYAQADLSVPGLSGVQIETASGTTLSLDRGPGGLRAKRVTKAGKESEWTVLGASRGESGILGEGIRQALLRDPTYRPSLDCALRFLGA